MVLVEQSAPDRCGELVRDQEFRLFKTRFDKKLFQEPEEDQHLQHLYGIHRSRSGRTAAEVHQSVRAVRRARAFRFRIQRIGDLQVEQTARTCAQEDALRLPEIELSKTGSVHLLVEHRDNRVQVREQIEIYGMLQFVFGVQIVCAQIHRHANAELLQSKRFDSKGCAQLYAQSKEIASVHIVRQAGSKRTATTKATVRSERT